MGIGSAQCGEEEVPSGKERLFLYVQFRVNKSARYRLGAPYSEPDGGVHAQIFADSLARWPLSFFGKVTVINVAREYIVFFFPQEHHSQ